MTSQVTELFAEHIQQLKTVLDPILQRYHYDMLVVHSGAPIYRFMDDMEYPFKVNPHFSWWVPVAVPDSVLVYRPGQKPQLYYFQPQDYWHLPPAAPDPSWATEFDLLPMARGEDWRAHVQDGNAVAVLGDAPRLAVHFTQAAINPTALIHEIDLCRTRKTNYEQACIAHANQMAARGHMAAADAFHAGASEFETHLAYLKATGHSEAELPYGNIIAQNNHGSVLHYHGLEHRIDGPRHSFLIDAGASFRGYAADITRTYSADSDGIFNQLIVAMETAQLDLVDSVRNGVDYRDLHIKAHNKIAWILKDAEIVKAPVDDMVDKGLTMAFFPHGLGHFLGLQVHDVGGKIADAVGEKIDPPEHLPVLRLTRQLEAGNVLTVEPGLYFIPQLLDPLRNDSTLGSAINWALVDELLPYGGIRIEDDVLVQAEGAPRNFSREAFAALALDKAA